MVDYGAKIDGALDDGSTALVAACYRGYTEIVRYLLDNGCNPSVRYRKGSTPLMAACYKGFVDIVVALLEREVDVNATDESGWSAIFIAAEQGYYNIVCKLLGKGANCHAINRSGYTPLMYACREGFPDIVEVLLEFGAHVDPIMLPSSENEIKSCPETNYQIASKSSVPIYYIPPLLLAVAGNDTDCVQHLIGHGANPNLDIRKYLPYLDRKAAEELVKQIGKPILGNIVDEGCSNKDLEKLIEIIDDGLANLYQLFSHPLLLASYLGNEDIIRLLLVAGATCECQNTKLERPIVIAAKENHSIVVRLLLSWGSSISMFSDFGYTYRRIIYSLASTMQLLPLFLLIFGKSKWDTEAIDYILHGDDEIEGGNIHHPSHKLKTD